MSASDSLNPLGLPRRVLFLNDVGFQYGAGIAQARQIEALLALGLEVGALAWATGEIKLEHVATRPVDPQLWLGIREVNGLEGDKFLSDRAVIAGLQLEVARFNPSVVLVGNLHAARWTLRLLPALRELGCRVIAFVHDAYLYTGRCAYPGNCELYLTGCNDTCPTADVYPQLAPPLIAGAWQLRREIFGGAHGIEIVANSRWSERMFRAAIPQSPLVDHVYLGADDRVFQPGDRAAARRQLGLPDDKPVVLCAAVNFQEPRKGGPELREIIAALRGEATFAAFGHNAAEIPGLVGLGYHLQAHQLATIYQAADVYLGTATEEAFGQTLMEAQLCGVPVVAFRTGGVEEIVQHDVTGKLVPNRGIAETVAALRAMLADRSFRERAGAQARAHAASAFGFEAHAHRWQAYLSKSQSPCPAEAARSAAQ